MGANSANVHGDIHSVNHEDEKQVKKHLLIDTHGTPAAAFAAPLSSTGIPERVDYLVIGGGATGMAFCDTLLRHATRPVSVVLVDSHNRPGGQWLDSYDFVRLHQPSDMYGVESRRLEPDGGGDGGEAHRATRGEIVDYYDEVCRDLEANFDFHFLGDTSFDVSQLLDEDDAGSAPDEGETVDHRPYKLSGDRTILARKVVDGRYLQPDLPVHVPPKFQFDPKAIQCQPVNYLAGQQTKEHYVVIGAGKTGMDAIVYLLEKKDVDPDNILWVVPNEAWITARENIGSCMEFLHECTSALKKGSSDEEHRRKVVESSEFFQRGFIEWEKQGRVYRFDKDVLPTKFKDATLSKSELAVIKKVKRVIRNGRVKSINNDGTLHFNDGTTVSLPWSSGPSQNVANNTMFVHCSAGAFNYSKNTKKPPPVFSRHRISIQDVYGTPGFCFVGSMIGKLESLGSKLSDAEKNAMCRAPSPDGKQASLLLGPSGGDIGVISTHHGLVQRLLNLRNWLAVPEIREWLVNHRLFNLRYRTAKDIDVLVKEMVKVLQEYDIVSEDMM